MNIYLTLVSADEFQMPALRQALNVSSHTKMTQKPPKGHLKFLQLQYDFLNLSQEQVISVYDCGQELSRLSKLSVWERQDYLLSSFSEFLNNKQLGIFEKHLLTQLHEDEKNIIERDRKQERLIEYNQILLKYCEEFVQDFFTNLHLSLFHTHFLSGQEKPKIDLLKAEYALYLDEQKNKILIEHFRYKRGFAPLELKRRLLEHKINHLWPDYSSFKSFMDIASKAANDYLIKFLPPILPEPEDFLKKKMYSFFSFRLDLMKKYHSLPPDTTIENIDWTDNGREEILMTIALIDEKKYGC